MKELFKNYEAAQKRTDEIEKRLDLNPESEELNEAWDKAYSEEYKAWEALINEIVRITKGAINRDTAKAMVATKRAELRSLVERIA